MRSALTQIVPIGSKAAANARPAGAFAQTMPTPTTRPAVRPMSARAVAEGFLIVALR